ncbi:MAG: DUF5906 domain-containing protein, partial [Petrotogales bacterium]
YYESTIKSTHNNPDLIERWGKDPSRLETQINCIKTGNKIPDTNKFEEDGEVFGPHRWPYKADSDPHYNDPPIQFIIDKRLMAIGNTWWDWKNKQSIGLGFDFDSIVDHADGVGISDKEIEKISNIQVPWIEVIRSTRGKGRHLYIWFQEPFPKTNNHHEHSALADSFLSLIARHTGINVEANKDVCGQVMWIHHIDANKENKGYELIKPATQYLTADHVPPNWRDHLEVVSGSRSKVRVQGWTPDGITDGDELDEMTQSHSKIPLDEIHLKILEDLEGTGHTALWVHDHHLWQGHTAGLKKVFDEWAERGTPMKGLFDTNTLDSDAGKPNCFARPKPNGAWDVYRFGEGTEEHPLWDKQGKWTHTTYNFPATLRQICMACGGFEGTEEKQGFMFQEMDDLKAALKLLGTDIKIPDKAVGRSLSLHRGPKERIILIISKERGDTKNDFPRFVKTSRGWEKWLKDAVGTSDKEQEEENIWSELDDKMRALKIKGPSGVGFDSWVIKDSGEGWVTHPRENVKSFLFSLGFNKPDPILGGAVYNSWLLVNEPFRPEYPGGRKWNRDAAQFAFNPIELSEGEIPRHPTWDMMLRHCGSDLDDYIKNLDWCKKWGILNGGDYLLAWIACMIQNPFGKLPYLFMYGPQRTGKSSFHEALETLFTTGVKKADRAMTSEQGYNGELKDVILAVIDEVDINKAGSTAYNKLKEWTTGDTISIHAKYKTVQDVKSTLHFVQMANSRNSLPVFPGDDRITAMHVPPIENEIPRDKFKNQIRDEAPHFLRTILDYEVQPSESRLMIPIIETQGKKDAIESNSNEIEQFIKNECYEIPGQAIKFSDFKKKFHATLEDYQKTEWKEGEIKKALSEKYPVGRGKKINQIIIGNLTFNPDVEPREPYRKEGGKIMRDEI